MVQHSTTKTLTQAKTGMLKNFIPVGAGVKFRLSDAVALNLGYTETLLMVTTLTVTTKVILLKTVTHTVMLV
jgi:hypothetical protein